MLAERTALVGRADEIAALREFLCGEHDAVALSLEGEAGIGKTELWRAGVELARERGVQVRCSRPAQTEAGFSFAAIADLLAGSADDAALWQSLPEPQRDALDAALLRRSAGAEPVAAHSVAAGFLTLLRGLAAEAAVLVAVDDVQWCDPASAAVLSFAVRRIQPADRVRFLVCRRSEGASDLPGETPAPVDVVGAVPGESLRRVVVGPMSFSATQRLMLTRTGWAAPRRLVRRIHEVSGGNPMFAVELARFLQPLGERYEIDGSLPLPDTMSAVLAQRFERQDVAVERALLAVALLAEANERQVVSALGGARGVQDALALGLLVRDGPRLRLVHPLLGLAARRRSTSADRRRLHRRLARVVTDAEAQARHLALGTLPPVEAVAARLARAAASASARGAWVAAGELSELAWHYTPTAEQRLRAERAVTAAQQLIRAGATDRARRVLETEAEDIPAGPLRAQARLQLAILAGPAELDTMLDAALDGADDASRAEILAERAFGAAASHLSELSVAAEWAGEAVELAGRAGDVALQCMCEVTLRWVEALRGRDVARNLDAVPAAWSDAVQVYNHPDRLRVVCALWRGETAEARRLLTELAVRAATEDDDWSIRVVLVHRFELETRVGDWHVAEAVCDELELAMGPFAEQASGSQHRCRALLAAARGDRTAAGVEAATVLAEDADTPRWQQLEAIRAVGFGALLTGDHHLAAEKLSAVQAAVRAAGIGDPGVFPIAPNLVEALLGCGDRVGAARVAADLAVATVEQDHPWGRAAGARCRGLLAVHDRDPDGAARALDEAVHRFAELGLSFDAARTRLALGSVLRRARRISAARDQLLLALDELESSGCAPLVRRARDEVSRLGGRHGGAAVTAAELRVARLVAEGLTNREIATALVVSVSTVEAHLTRAYAKLGVRSRTELARRVLAGLDP